MKRIRDCNMCTRLLPTVVSAHLVVSIVTTSIAIEDAPPTAPRIAEFRLPTIEGKHVEVSTDDEDRFTVVAFLGTQCPLAKLYGARLQKMSQEFANRGVRFIGINSNQHDSLADLRKYGEKHGIRFPLAKDYENRVADQFGAERTPEVFLLDEKLTVRYQGRIDDQYRPGRSKSQPTQRDLRNAIEELLADKPVTVPQTDASGCFIGRVKRTDSQSDVTYTKQISRLLQTHCIECHRDGEIAPFALTDYEEVIGWADTMVEVIDQGRMPPWHASNAHGQFKNARHMPRADKELLRQWVDAGMPYGDLQELPQPSQFVSGWQLPRAPDEVIAMRDRPFVVPPDGTVEYQYFVVDPQFEEDKWVTAAQVVPGNSSVVHHAIVFIRPPDGSRFKGIGWLSAYVPGNRPSPLPQGAARHVPAGSKLVFQMHYTPTGSEQQDTTNIGLVFGEEETVTHELVTLVGINQQFEIPPREPNHPVHAQLSSFSSDATLLSVMPHMHWRGKSFTLTSNLDNDRQILLEVPAYDFNWQHSYEFATPLPLASIKSLNCDFSFDNSSANPVNPDPDQRVTWGDQTWEEMAVAFFAVVQPREETTPATDSSSSNRDKSEPSAAVMQRIEKSVDRFFKRFDTNSDGVVLREETPRAVRAYGFWQFDTDRDDKITRDEMRKAVQQREGI